MIYLDLALKLSSQFDLLVFYSPGLSFSTFFLICEPLNLFHWRYRSLYSELKPHWQSAWIFNVFFSSYPYRYPQTLSAWWTALWKSLPWVPSPAELSLKLLKSWKFWLWKNICSVEGKVVILIWRAHTIIWWDGANNSNFSTNWLLKWLWNSVRNKGQIKSAQERASQENTRLLFSWFNFLWRHIS